MATLQRIKICGIRSFGCEEEDVQTVEFHKPLTLILGENGCGKSTIIECLRYLTAQKEPAGKGTFVHDPTLTSRATVKGFVKLKMKDVCGATVDLCRQVQATKTKKSLTTKSLDNVITRTDKETKEKVSISNRCVDFTYEISRIFGVSRAILENVVFCTQEDSLWPLDTDQKLKEKFDQIFDSDKYNKCISKVRDKRKKLKDVLKTSEIELKYLKENKAMAAEKRRQIKTIRNQIESCNLEIEVLSTSLAEVEDKLKNINIKELNLSKNHTLKEMKKSELKVVEGHLEELKRRIKTPYNGSDEDLKKEIKNFNNLLITSHKQIEEEEEKIRRCNTDEISCSKTLMKEQGMLGQLLKEEEINGERIRERNKVLSKLASELDINVPANNDSVKSIEKLIKEVKAKIMEKEDELEKVKKNLEEKDQSLQSYIDELREKSSVAQNEVNNKEKSLNTCQLQKDNIKQELKEASMSAGKLTSLESKLNKINQELENLQKSTNIESLKKNVKKSIEERNKLEENLSEVEEKVKKLQQQSTISTELDFQSELKTNKDSQYRRLINKHEENLKILFDDVPTSSFKLSVQGYLADIRKKLKDLNSSLSKKEKEVTELEIKRKHIKEKIKLMEDALRSDEEEIYDICNGDEFEETVMSVQNQIKDLQGIKGTLSSSEFMYQKYIQALKKAQPCCPLCHRDFNEQSEAQSLVEELTSKIREVPNKLKETENKLETEQIKYNKLLTLQSKYKQISVSKDKEIPLLQSELGKIESLLRKVQKEKTEIEKAIISPQSDEALCLSLQDDMVLLDQLNLESNQLEKLIEKLRKQLGLKDLDKNFLKESLLEQDTIRQQLKFSRQQAEKTQADLSNFNEQLQNKQSTKNSLMEEIHKIEAGISKKKNLAERLDELQKEESVCKIELNENQLKLDLLKKKLEEALSKKMLEKNCDSEKIERMTHSVNWLLKDLHVVEGHNKVIAAHERKEINERIEAVQKVMKKMENEIKDLKNEKEKAEKKINDIKKASSNQELMERELEDNLKMREKTKEAENLRNEVIILEEKFGNINFDTILKEKRKLKSKEEELTKDKAKIQGRVAEMENQVQSLERELLGKVFKNIDNEYNNESLKAEVLKAIGKDLERYATTMEYAMMTYHKHQMTRVNSFIREYWRKIYQGNDIDYIEIQTDNIESTEKRRNYNYKVVQIKSDVYLDMRNKCSAGQKMLASLIIRLALAETFSTNCGILTLDEPTTNLDRKNIKNLARTLNEVLLTKQNATNPNFQLIVITHDEEFLQELMELDMVNEYVKVDRNMRGKTIISNKNLNEDRNIGTVYRVPFRQQFDYD